MSAHYDRLYDMGVIAFCGVPVMNARMARRDNDMREGGLEPPSLAAPDPKSDPLASNRLAPECGRATQRHETLPAATQSTTDSTTREVFVAGRALSDDPSK